MGDNFKERSFPILMALTFIFFITTINSCSGLQKIKSLKKQEENKRLDAEEEASNLMRESTLWQEKMKAKDKEVELERSNHQKTKEALLEAQAAAQAAKDELAKINKVKEALEEELKDVLITSRPKRAKR